MAEREKHCVKCKYKKLLEDEAKSLQEYLMVEAPCESCPINLMLTEVQNFRAVDVNPVIKGHWLPQYKTDVIDKDTQALIQDGYRCSICGRVEPKKEPFCNCGADMKDDYLSGI